MARLPSHRQEAWASSIAALERLLPGLDQSDRQVAAQALEALRRAQAEEDRVAVIRPAEPAEPADTEDEVVLRQAWGRTVRARREAIGLTREQLARRAGVVEATIKKLEAGLHTPSPRVLEALLGVAELRLDLCDPLVQLILGRSLQVEVQGELLANWWLVPGFDVVRMARELERQLNGRGGHVEQMYLYLDPLSAASYCALSSLPEGTGGTHRAPLPGDGPAEAILSCAGGAAVDVIALGPGDGRREVALLQQLQRSGPRDLRLYLLDSSQPLLNVAYQHAAETLLCRGGVGVFAVQGDFYHLPRYAQLLYAPSRSHRRRLLCMLGATFGNLQHELLFVHESLGGFTEGDLLLLEVGLASAPAARPEEVRRQDPLLCGRMPAPWRERFEEWLLGPLRRHARGVSEIEVSMALAGAACTVPGSYAIEVRAAVRSALGDERQFSLLYEKRYDEQALSECLREEGWSRVASWRREDGPVCLSLCQRRAGR